MALQTVLKNICSFLEILENASTSQVADWDELCLHNAFQWAAYCEQVYKQSKGKSYSENLDLEIRKLCDLLSGRNSRASSVCLELLQHSSRLLMSNLLQNCHLRQDMLSVLLTLSGSPSAFVLESSHLVQLKAILQLLLTLGKDLNVMEESNVLQAVKGSSNNSCLKYQFSVSKRSSPDLWESDNLLVECLAKLLLQHLSRVLRNRSSSSSTDRIESLLLKKFAQTELGQVILAAAVVSLPPSTVDSSLNSQIQKLLEECLKSSIVTSQNKIPLDLLVRVCSRSIAVYSCYMKHLIACCNTLKPVYEGDAGSNPHNLVKWRPAAGCSSAAGYDEVKRCFSYLIFRGSSHVSMATEQIMSRLADAGCHEASVWPALVSDLKSISSTEIT